MLRLRRDILDLAAQAVDIDINDLVIYIAILAPNLIQDRCARQDSVGISEQKFQDLKFYLRQFNRSVPNIQQPFVEL